MTCPCGEPTPDTATVGPACVSRLMQDLAETPVLCDDLEVALSRQSVSGQRVGGRSSEKPLPYDETASNALEDLRANFVSAILVLERDGDPMPADNVPSMSRWLLTRIQRIAHHDAGPDIFEDISGREARRQNPKAPADPARNLPGCVPNARRALTRGEPKAYAGPCGAETDGGVCGADLYARLGAETCICAQCGAEYDVAVRREWLLASAEDTLLTTGEIAKALPLLLGVEITADRVRKWAQRDRIVAHGVDTLGRPLYRVGDVRALVEARAKGMAA